MIKYCLYLTEVRTFNDLNNDGHNNILMFTIRATFLNWDNQSRTLLFKILYVFTYTKVFIDRFILNSSR